MLVDKEGRIDPPQRKMMRTAARYHEGGGLILFLLGMATLAGPVEF